VRGIFFEEDAARAVVARLLSDGFTAELERDRLAGEDDDEGHPWSVRTDAPDFALEMLVDAHDGWLDAEEPEPGPPLVLPPRKLPVDLPAAPIRIKRPEAQ
jgi:hypothetical protein